MTTETGRELDAWIAEYITFTGYEVYVCLGQPYLNYANMPQDEREKHYFVTHSQLDKNGLWAPVPRYSSDIAAAHLMEERIKELGLHQEYAVELARIIGESISTVTAFDFAHASAAERCRAAVKMLERER